MASSCKREVRSFQVSPPSADAVRTVSVSDLYPGPTSQPAAVSNEYDNNAYAISEGKRLFFQFNCAGCHFHGGGGIGPPLMDDRWIYGSQPEQVFASIVEGRPNGMPSFRGKIVNYQVWQLTSYVRSMSGLTNSQASSGRDDHMKSSIPENSKTPEQPKNSVLPKSAEMPG